MKIVIASDIHGSAYYTKVFFERVAQEKPDMVILLGDIYYHGPRNPFPKEYAPMAVAEILNANKKMLVVIKGNCDSEVDQMISEFSFIEGFFALQLEKRKLVCVHGHKMEKSDLPELKVGDIVAYGHYHTALLEIREGIIYINPGSLALPKDDNYSYCIIEDNVITIKSLDDRIIKNYIL
ncbi:MAG: phosphodiesterase [Clostridia bacterium]|nr:phosphodiesterase [Clostridia bacterium]